MNIVDLTHTFDSDMPAYPGDPKSTLVQATTIEKDGYTDHKLSTLMHVGTHMDAPLHMIPNGRRMDDMPLSQCFGPGVLIDAREKKTVDADLLHGITIPKNAFVLVYTGYEEKWKTDDFFVGHPPITEAFAQKMVEANVHGVGMDMIGPDEPPYPTHKILLGNGIFIIENLTNLDKLLGKSFDVMAIPMKLHTDAAPVRVIATLQGESS